jgi:hypothetical protein
MKVIASMMFSVCVQLQQSGRVPSFGALLVTCSSSRQIALEADLCLLSDSPENRPHTSFPYKTIRGRNIPPKQTRIKIWANNSPTQNNISPLTKKPPNLFLSTALVWTPQTFLARQHARTPYACMRTPVQGARRRSITTNTKHILQKNVGLPETLGNDASGGASKPHRSKYIASAQWFYSFHSIRRFSYGR